MMNRALTYSEQLRDPRWQRRRLEVFERDGWRCRHCRREGEQLHAHHIAYIKGAAPWEYGSDWLITLCDPCHSNEHRFGDFAWADARVAAVNCGAIGAQGQDWLAKTVGRLLACAEVHGLDAVSDAMQRFENIVADAQADRLDAHRGPGDSDPIETLRVAGLSLRACGDGRLIVSPVSALTDELDRFIRDNKNEILFALGDPQADAVESISAWRREYESVPETDGEAFIW